MIDGECSLCWQKQWDRSPGMTMVMVRGPDPAGKSPDVNFRSMLRLGWYEFGLSRKRHSGFWTFKSILVSFVSATYVWSTHPHAFTPVPEVLEIVSEFSFLPSTWWFIQSMSYGVDVKQGSKMGREWALPCLPLHILEPAIPTASTNQFGSTG